MVAQAIFSPPVESEASDLGDPDIEIPRVARAIVEHVGRMNPALGASGTVVERGEEVMGRTLAEYTNWLRAVHDRNRRAVQYAVSSKGHRVAVCVLLGTTRGVFDAVCAGEMSDAEIDPDDILPASGKYILVNALAPVGEHEGLPSRERERAEEFCVFRQIAYFTRGLRPFRPAFYVIAGNPHVADRLRRQGFRPTGNPLKGTEKTVMVLCHRREVGGPRMTLKERLSYLQLRLAARVFRVINFHKWRREDRRNRAR